MPRPSQEQLGHWLNLPMQRNWPGANRGTFVNNRWERWNHPGNFNAFVQDRGNRVRSAAVNDFRANRFNRFFTPDWFRTAHRHGFFWNFRPAAPWFWWNFATTASLADWLAWGGVTPLYYNYGDNVVYGDDTIYLDQQPVANVDAYIDQATQLALAGAQALAPAAASTEEAPAPQPEWLPLGVFALTHEEQGEPTIFLQLAVTKDGLIGGTYTNASTGETQNVTGKIDKQSQRAAWIIGNNRDAVMEAGAFNLTQDQAPVLVHWGKEKTQTWLLTRVPAPTQ
jgi:hypothetical protein